MKGPRARATDLGRRLAGVRLQRGLSQGTVARLARIAPSYLSRIETGKVQPTFRTVLRIASGLNVPVEELLARLEPGESGIPRPCPVTTSGQCLLDLIHSEVEAARAAGEEAFTPRQVRLMRRFGTWLRSVTPDRLGAVEILLEEMQHGTSPEASSLPCGTVASTGPPVSPASERTGRTGRSQP